MLQSQLNAERQINAELKADAANRSAAEADAAKRSAAEAAHAANLLRQQLDAERERASVAASDCAKARQIAMSEAESLLKSQRLDWWVATRTRLQAVLSLSEMDVDEGSPSLRVHRFESRLREALNECDMSQPIVESLVDRLLKRADVAELFAAIEIEDRRLKTLKRRRVEGDCQPPRPCQHNAGEDDDGGAAGGFAAADGAAAAAQPGSAAAAAGGGSGGATDGAAAAGGGCVAAAAAGSTTCRIDIGCLVGIDCNAGINCIGKQGPPDSEALCSGSEGPPQGGPAVVEGTAPPHGDSDAESDSDDCNESDRTQSDLSLHCFSDVSDGEERLRVLPEVIMSLPWPKQRWKRRRFPNVFVNCLREEVSCCG